MLRLAQFPSEPGVADALKKTLQNSAAIEALIRVRSKFDSAALSSLLTDVARQLWSANDNARQLAIQLVTAFRLAAFEQELVATLQNYESSAVNQTSALRALREIGTSQDELLSNLAKSTKDRGVRQEAILTLASSKSVRAAPLVIELWPSLNALQRRLTLERLTSSKNSATALMIATKAGAFPKSDLDATTLDKLNVVIPNNADLKSLTEELTALYQPVLRLDGKDESWYECGISFKGEFTVETWVKLAPGIDNNDSILGAPGSFDLNFYDARFRVWAGPDGDIVVAKKKMSPNVWTHLAVTRDSAGIFSIYINGELDNTATKPITKDFEHLQVGRSNPSGGTDGWFSDFRAWTIARSPEQIRQNFDRRYSPAEFPDRLFRNNWGDKGWAKSAFKGGARIEKVDDLPTLLTAEQAKQQNEKFAHYDQLAKKNGDMAHGKTLFSQTCATCHTVAGQGGQIGPVLNGAGAMGTEGLLRAILTPNAAMEAGYRTFRVELKDGDVLDGFLVSQDNDAIVLRQPNAQDRRIPQDDVRRARFTKISMMPEVLLDSLPDQDATDLLAYLKTLK
jgi:putative heme-binding domain-containing protein